jgi:hypothetical protein
MQSCLMDHIQACDFACEAQQGVMKRHRIVLKTPEEPQRLSRPCISTKEGSETLSHAQSTLDHAQLTLSNAQAAK